MLYSALAPTAPLLPSGQNGVWYSLPPAPGRAV
jgi:hypothetical protein